MKKRLSKIALLAGLVGGLSFSNAATNKADARIAPGSLTGDCIDGTQWTYTWGWFGSGLTETINPCQVSSALVVIDCWQPLRASGAAISLLAGPTDIDAVQKVFSACLEWHQWWLRRGPGAPIP